MSSVDLIWFLVWSSRPLRFWCREWLNARPLTAPFLICPSESGSSRWGIDFFAFVCMYHYVWHGELALNVWYDSSLYVFANINGNNGWTQHHSSSLRLIIKPIFRACSRIGGECVLCGMSLPGHTWAPHSWIIYLTGCLFLIMTGICDILCKGSAEPKPKAIWFVGLRE